MSTYPDIAPTISVGLGYSNYLNYIDFDMEAVTERLRAGGLSDQQILDTTIEFSDRHPRSDYRPDILVFGNYVDADKKIAVNAIYHALRSFVCRTPDDEEGIHQMANNTLAHELEHRISSVDAEQQRINRKHNQRAAIRTLSRWAVVGTAGAVTLGSIDVGLPRGAAIAIGALAPIAVIQKLRNRPEARRQRYLNHPEETRCRDVSDNEATTFVNIGVRPLTVINAVSPEDFTKLAEEVISEYYDNIAKRRETDKQELAAARIQRISTLLSFVLRTTKFAQRS